MLNVVAVVQFLESRIWFLLNPALIRMPLRKKSTMNEYEKIDNMLFQLEYELLCLSLSINLLSSFYSVVLLCLWEGKSGEGGTVLNIVGCPVLNLVRTNQSLSALSLSLSTQNMSTLFVILLCGDTETPAASERYTDTGFVSHSSVFHCHLPATSVMPVWGSQACNPEKLALEHMC